MFQSFFPKPKMFFLSAVAIGILSMIVWYYFGASLGNMLGLPFPDAEAPKTISLGFFATNNFLTFYLYFLTLAIAFTFFWFIYSPHRWQWWSIAGSILIIFVTWISVQVSVVINYWSRGMFDNMQFAMSGEKDIPASQFYQDILIFAQIAFVYVAIYVASRFFISHYIFRWRTAMNNYYISKWSKVRHIEGASQRIQEDTMRFASIMEGLGVAVIDSVMTLFAFLPILYSLSTYVTELPIVGSIPAPLLTAAIFWAIFGTLLMFGFGIKLPGLEFKNQRVEAAYRKELVYGEDDASRAEPPTLNELFANVRKNYFTLYFHYLYFNVARSFYVQADNIFAICILIPSVAAGTITYGILQQILRAFGQVSSSFQFLVSSWPTIIEMMSVRKRLVAFEAAIDGEELPEIDQEYLAGKE